MNKNILNDFDFGYADADTEFLHSREIFEKAFYDPFNYINELVNGPKFLLVGRKGAGKSAYKNKLMQLSQDKLMLIDTVNVDVGKIDYSLFDRIVSCKNEGGRKYESIWKLIIYLSIICKTYETGVTSAFDEIIEILLENEISLDEEIKITLKKFNKKRGQLTLPHSEERKKIELDEFLIKCNRIIKTEYRPQSKMMLIFDGLDDILRFNNRNSNLLSGLIRTINEFNNDNFSKRIKIKGILLIRTDILYLLHDPDLNKIKRDASIELIWDTYSLRELINLRLRMINKNILIDNLLCNSMSTKNTFDYLLDYTFLRPRDLLQFFVIAKEVFPKKEAIDKKNDFLAVLRLFSSKYLLEEIKDELTGFLEDEQIGELNTIFKSLGNRNFSFEEFKNAIIKVEGKVEQDNNYYTKFLITLLNTSFIGQIEIHKEYRKIEKKEKPIPKIFFRYKSPTMTIRLDSKFILHQSLKPAFNFSIS